MSIHSLEVAPFDDFCPSAGGEKAWLGVLLIGGRPDLFGDACRTSVCLRGSDRAVDPTVLVGVVSREDLLPAGLVTVVVLRFVTTVCFLPLGSVSVSLSP